MWECVSVYMIIYIHNWNAWNLKVTTMACVFACAVCTMCMAIKIVHIAQKVCVKCEWEKKTRSDISLQCDPSSVPKMLKTYDTAFSFTVLCQCTVSVHISMEPWRFLISLAIDFYKMINIFSFIFFLKTFSTHSFKQ